MVLLRLTVKIPPPDVVQTLSRRRSTSSTAAQDKPKPTSFLLVIRDPQQLTLGELTWMITEKWSKLRPDAAPLQIKKLLDDEHDTHDLDLDLTVADVFVDNGKASRDGLDQRATVRVVQAPSTKAPFRYGSVVQDWNAVSDHYARVNASRPRPAVPLFPLLGSSQRGPPSGRVLPSVAEVNPPSFPISIPVPVPEVAESVYNEGDKDKDNDLAGRRRGEMSPVLGDDAGLPAVSSPVPLLIPSLASGVRSSLDAQSAVVRGPDHPQQEKPASRRRSGRASLLNKFSISGDDLPPSSKPATRGAKRRRSSFRPFEPHDSPPAKRQNISKQTQSRREPSLPMRGSLAMSPAVHVTTPALEIIPPEPTQAPHEPQDQSKLKPIPTSNPGPELESAASDAEPTAESHQERSPELSPQLSPEINEESSVDPHLADDQAPTPSSSKHSPSEKEGKTDDKVNQEEPEQSSTPRQRISTKYPSPFVSANALHSTGKVPHPAEYSPVHDDSSDPGPTANSHLPDAPGVDPMEVDSPSQAADLGTGPKPSIRVPKRDAVESNVESSLEESSVENSSADESNVEESSAEDSNAGKPSVSELGESASNTSESCDSEPNQAKVTPPRSPPKRRLSTQGVERVDLSPEANKSSRHGPGPGQMGLGITASPPKPRRRQTAKRQGMSMVEMQCHTNGKTPSPPVSQVNGSSKAAGLYNGADSASSMSDHSAPELEMNLREQVRSARGRKKSAQVVRQMEELLGLMRELRAAKKADKINHAAKLEKQLDERYRALEAQGYKLQPESRINENGVLLPDITSASTKPTRTNSNSAQQPALLPSPVISTQNASKVSREDVPLIRGRKLNFSPVNPRARKIRQIPAGEEKQQGDTSPIVKKEGQSSEFLEASAEDSSESGSGSGSDQESVGEKSQAKSGSEFDSDAESTFEDLSTPPKPKANNGAYEVGDMSPAGSSDLDQLDKKQSKPIANSPPKVNGKANGDVSPSTDSSDSDSDAESTGGDIPFARKSTKAEPEPVSTASATRPRTRGLGRARNVAKMQATTPQPQPTSSPFAQRERSVFNTLSQPARRQSSVSSTATPGRRPRTTLKGLISSMKRA